MVKTARTNKASGDRRRARVLAMQALYEVDVIKGHDPLQVLHRLIDDARISPAMSPFVEDLVVGVLGNRDLIDSMLHEKAPLWPLEQVSAIDRNILRLAIFEILFDNKVPTGAAINEAVELAKIYGSESSGKFVNGVLGAIVQDETKTVARS